MTVSSNSNGIKIIWNEERKRWETLDGKPYINNKEICSKCGKPQLMIGWLKRQYHDLLFKIFPVMPSYIAKEWYGEFDEKYKEFRVMTENNKRFSFSLRQNTTQYEINDNWKTGYFPFLEPFYYKKSAKDLAKFLNELQDENILLKQALREELEDNGNKYYIDLFDELFDLHYHEWEGKKTKYREYVDWKEVLKKNR